MISLKLSEISKACAGDLHAAADPDIKSITTDSRKVEESCLFAAIKGERTDGHNYIEAAARKGAAAVLCENKPENTEIPYILVSSTLKALQDIASYILNKKAIPKVGIGGSVGKTSTKEAVAAVLEQKYSVLKTQGNFNNDLGVPLTVFNMEDENEAAVIEMGIDDFGQMRELAGIVRPNVCVLTNIADCHLENLGDRNGVLKAKSEMFEYVTEKDRIVLNGDDAHLSTVKEYKGVKPVFFGLDKKNDIWADNIKDEGIFGTGCDIHTKEGSFSVMIPKPGVHMVYNAMAAAAVGLIFSLSLEEIKRGIEGMGSISGRFNIINANDICIIDDCYNANPASMRASLGSLSKAETRKIAVLGDMGELGENEQQLHADLGKDAAKLDIDVFVCIGKLSRLTSKEIEQDKNKTVITFDDIDSFIKEAGSIIKSGDTVLVKASHFMGFDKIVEALQTTVLDK